MRCGKKKLLKSNAGNAMELYGIPIDIKNKPPLDADFIPFSLYKKAFKKSVEAEGGEKLAIALTRNGGQVSVYETEIHGAAGLWEADALYVERLVKFLLWMKGGYRITICGNESIADHIRRKYTRDGERAFDAAFMEDVYQEQFEVNSIPYVNKPAENETGIRAGGNLKGCRIGFDAGGSDRKVAAVIDGETVYSEEVVWHPKLHSDPGYHYKGILNAFKTAASHMPRVDAIGVSSAGIYLDNRCSVASLFIKVSRDVFDREVKDIYIRAAKAFGDIPVTVCNDGDVAALAGAVELKKNNVLGIAMVTSEAA